MVTATLDSLRQRSRRYADQERAGLSSDDFVSDEELNAHINDAALQLLSLVTESYGVAAAIQVPIVSVSGQETYPLPADLYEVVSLEYKDRPIWKYGALEAGQTADSGCTCPRWQQGAGPVVRILPAITESGSSLRLWYAQNYPTLANASDPIVLWPHGDTFIAATAAMAMLGKEESDFAYPLGIRQQAEENIRQNGRRMRPKKMVHQRRRHLCWGGSRLGLSA